ncbi:MAG: type VI secretion system tip protein VgrG [Lewinellaceae bacterium]|nr:type VI secretion system tip protein VgrG [Saprospiraceae bacterium]MCB9331306.1 type VI secretion system tip protein VgrG [Lewinellaceae bacterium]
MPDSPFNTAGEIIRVDILLGGKPINRRLQVAAVNVERGLNSMPTAKITILLPASAEEDSTFFISGSKDFVPGQEIEIKAGYEPNSETIFKGIIVNLGIRSRSDEQNEMVVRCSDKAVKMTQGRKSACYQNQKDSEIISAIVDEYGLQKEVETTSFGHPQIVKYQATDWDFLLTRAEANGLMVYAEDGKIFLKKLQASGSAVLEVEFGRDVFNYDLNIETRHQIPSMTCLAWDMKTQAMVEGKSSEPALNAQGNLKARDAGTGIGLSDATLATTAPLENPELKTWANAELVHARMNYILGSIRFYGNAKPKLNTLIQLKGFGDRFNGNALISGIDHKIKAGRWTTTVRLGLPSERRSETLPAVSAPPAGGLLPAVSGLQNGTVKKIDADPAGQYRIQVNVPAITADGEGIWARMANFYATSGKGSFFMPEVGDEVALGFLNDDPRFPVILGMLYSSSNKPPYTAAAENKIKAIVTKNDLKIEFNDGDKILTISTPAGNQFVLSDKDKSVTVKDQNGNKVELNTSGISLNSAKDVVITASGKIDLKAATGITAAASGGDVSLNGLNVTAKANIAFSAQGTAQAELKSGGNTTIKGAMVMIN